MGVGGALVLATETRKPVMTGQGPRDPSYKRVLDAAAASMHRARRPELQIVNNLDLYSGFDAWYGMKVDSEKRQVHEWSGTRGSEL